MGCISSPLRVRVAALSRQELRQLAFIFFQHVHGPNPPNHFFLRRCSLASSLCPRSEDEWGGWPGSLDEKVGVQARMAGNAG